MRPRLTVFLPSLFAVAAAVVYVLAPTTVAEPVFQAIAWGAVITFVVGARRHGATGTPWTMIGGGFALFALGDLLFSLHEHVFHVEPFPSGADVAYLAGYPLLAAGLAALVRRSRPGGDRIALIDAGIIVVPAAVATWIYLVDPYTSDAGMTLLEKTVSCAYPLGDLLCLAVLVRLLTSANMTRRSGQPALGLLVAGFATMLVADLWFLIAQLQGAYVSGGWSDSLYVAPYVALGAAAISPSIGDVGHPRPRQDVALGRARLALLAVSALVTPLLLIVQTVEGGGITVPLVVVGTVVTFLLVVARMAGLVQALEASRARLEYDATHDMLTGLPNRTLFARELQAVVDRRQAGALLFIDLDRFKQVNDTLGHAAGDDVLVEVARRLRASVRTGDVVGRLSGDEFVALITTVGQTGVYIVAERILRELVVDSGTLERPVRVTASIGLVTWRADADTSAEELLVEADRAMYQAKDHNGNQLVIAR